MKTTTELRKALNDLGVYTPEEVDAQVAIALQKGSVSLDGADGQADALAAETEALDQAALAWALEKASKDDGDDDEDDEQGSFPYGGGDDEDEDEDEDDDSDTVEAMEKALGAAITSAVNSTLGPIKAELQKARAELSLIKGRVEAVGDLAKALVTTSRDQLSKGGNSNGEILAKLASLEKAITAPRGDFRGVSADQIEVIGAPGDRPLKKGAPGVTELQAGLLAKQRAAYQAGNDGLASQIASVIQKVDATSTPEYRAEIAAKFSV